MPDTVYAKLRQQLDTHPVGCPSAPEIIEILKLLFSKEEATIALGFGFAPFNIEEIAYRADVSEQDAGRHLE